MDSLFAPVKRTQELEQFFNSLVVEMNLSQEEVKFLQSIIVDTAHQAATDAVSKNLMKYFLHFYKFT